VIPETQFAVNSNDGVNIAYQVVGAEGGSPDGKNLAGTGACGQFEACDSPIQSRPVLPPSAVIEVLKAALVSLIYRFQPRKLLTTKRAILDA
jgi:hypothetical protein